MATQTGTPAFLQQATQYRLRSVTAEFSASVAADADGTIDRAVPSMTAIMALRRTDLLMDTSGSGRETSSF